MANNMQNGAIVQEEQAATEKQIRYIEGRPKQYRFDAKAGIFNINGTKEVGPAMSFTPVAWRFFKDNILNMGLKEWVEIFFVDDRNCLSALLFHTYSVENLIALADDLFYDELTLADVKLTAKAVAHTKELPAEAGKTKKTTYYIAEFSYQIVEQEQVKKLADFARTNCIYRRETLAPLAKVAADHNYYNPLQETELNGELLQDEDQ